MSGGSWDYFYCKLEEVGFRLRRDSKPLRAALGLLLLQASKAMHDIEWNDSCDGSDTEDANIIATLGTQAPALMREAAEQAIYHAIEQAQEAIVALRKATEPTA